MATQSNAEVPKFSVSVPLANFMEKNEEFKDIFAFLIWNNRMEYYRIAN